RILHLPPQCTRALRRKAGRGSRRCHRGRHRDEGESMTDRGTAPPPIGALTRAAAAGCIGGALSVQRHETAIRRLGLLLATGTGAWTALTAGGVVTPPAAGRSSDDGPRPVPPAAAAALGVGMFAVA